MKHTYDFPRPSVTVDCVVFAGQDAPVPVLLLMVQRKDGPYQDCWALPGGFLNPAESIINAAIRELKEETTLELLPHELEQVHTYGDPGRDPRGWVISVAHVAYIQGARMVKGQDDAKYATWFDIKALPNELAFDHLDIITMACAKKGLTCKISPKT